jgi:hypothetical protein
VKTRIEIERLVIDGLPLTPRDGHLVAAALEARLSALLLAQGGRSAFSSAAAIPDVDAGVLAVDRRVSPTRLGHQAAAAVHRAIAGPASTEPPR